MTAPARLDEVAPDVRAAIRVLARLARVAEQACQSTGISLPQYRLLLSISEGSQRASEIARKVGVSRPTLTSLVDGLEQAGLLRRAPVPTDRRGIELIATPAGREAVDRAELALADRLNQLVTPDTNRPVTDMINDLGSALDREGEARD
jgi:DNA-binding MarR family transcriptional regulator